MVTIPSGADLLTLFRNYTRDTCTFESRSHGETGRTRANDDYMAINGGDDEPSVASFGKANLTMATPVIAEISGSPGDATTMTAEVGGSLSSQLIQ